MCLVLSQPRFGGTEEDDDFLDPAKACSILKLNRL